MPSTPSGIVYPSITDAPNIPADMQTMANSIETLIAAAPINDNAKPRCHAYDSAGNLCISAGAVVKLIDFDTEAFDTTASMHPLATSSRLIAPIDGLYRFYSLVRFPSSTYTVGLLNCRRDAAGSSVGGTSMQNIQFHALGGSTGPAPCINFPMIPLAAGQYLEVFASQTSGGNQTTVPGLFGTFATLEYLCAIP